MQTTFGCFTDSEEEADSAVLNKHGPISRPHFSGLELKATLPIEAFVMVLKLSRGSEDPLMGDGLGAKFEF